ncbi:hypothetical protein MSAN_01153900 [Mycena sanguinolenta]|uniref:Uncharacterized protein n=1 Tax=Mycena sanguinolenta TaxID=230812 RepID=A0A8H6YHA2_9AGAR|nr:hypothetical protein MSAN_01153900 [Mycena sanguinolenta]
MDQTINDLQMQLDDMRKMWKEECLLRQRAELELKTLRRRLAEATNINGAEGGNNLNDTHYPLPNSEEMSRHFTRLENGLEYRLVGGIYIPNEEGIRWFEQKYDFKLPEDHSGDASVRMNLGGILEDEGHPFGVEYVPGPPGTPWCDFLAVTHWETRDWEYAGPESVGEVTDPERQFKDSPREEEVRNILRKQGLQAKEFKCYYLYHYVD